MSSESKKKNRRGRRAGAARRSVSSRESDRLPCAICHKPIQDITSAISRPSDNEPVHFDCALASVREKLKPQEGAEKIIYLGKGSFAAVELEAYQQFKLIIHRRIDWEKPDEIAEWRRNLRTNTP